MTEMQKPKFAIIGAGNLGQCSRPLLRKFQAVQRSRKAVWLGRTYRPHRSSLRLEYKHRSV